MENRGEFVKLLIPFGMTQRIARGKIRRYFDETYRMQDHVEIRFVRGACYVKMERYDPSPEPGGRAYYVHVGIQERYEFAPSMCDGIAEAP